MRCLKEYRLPVVTQAVRSLVTAGSVRSTLGSQNMRTVVDGELVLNEGTTHGTDVGVRWSLITIQCATGVR